MIRIVNYYRTLSFQEKTVFTAKLSILMNLSLGIGKTILYFFFGVFFLVAAIVNYFIMLTKLECYLGIKYPNKKSFEYRNKCIGVFLFIAGLEYAIYMARMIFTEVAIMKYDMILGIIIACVSFVELAIAIKGCFKSYGKGHYYRNIKLNWRLIMLPHKAIDYVIIHELCHIRHMNHQEGFWKEVSKYCPDYLKLRRKCKKEFVYYENY